MPAVWNRLHQCGPRTGYSVRVSRCDIWDRDYYFAVWSRKVNASLLRGLNSVLHIVLERCLPFPIFNGVTKKKWPSIQVVSYYCVRSIAQKLKCYCGVICIEIMVMFVYRRILDSLWKSKHYLILCISSAMNQFCIFMEMLFMSFSIC